MKSHMRSQEDLERLSQLHHELPSDLEALEIRLTDPDPLVRFAVVKKLWQLEDPHVADLFLTVLTDEAIDVRTCAVISLSDYPDVRFLPAVIDRLTHDPLPHVRVWAAITVGTIGGESAAEALRLALHDPDERVREFACLHYADQNDVRASSEIRRLLSDPEPRVRSAAARALIHIQSIDEDVINVLLNDPSWGTRKELAHELVRAKVADERIISAIEQLMKEPEAAKYESQLAEYRMAMAEDHTADDDDDGLEEMSEEDKAEMQMMEEMDDKPLAELLQKARVLLGGEDINGI
ncbi:MAG: HEAT repeat domain-containing protein [Armatimonadota bacterium]